MIALVPIAVSVVASIVVVTAYVRYRRRETNCYCYQMHDGDETTRLKVYEHIKDLKECNDLRGQLLRDYGVLCTKLRREKSEVVSERDGARVMCKRAWAEADSFYEKLQLAEEQWAREAEKDRRVSVWRLKFQTQVSYTEELQALYDTARAEYKKALDELAQKFAYQANGIRLGANAHSGSGAISTKNAPGWAFKTCRFDDDSA